MENKEPIKFKNVLDSSLIVRAEGASEPAKKEWIYTHNKLPKEIKSKLRKEIEELNKQYDSGEKG